MINVKLENGHLFKRKLEEFAKATGQEAGESLKDIARLQAQNLASKTFPRGTGNNIKDALIKGIYKDIAKAYATDPQVYNQLRKISKGVAGAYFAMAKTDRQAADEYAKKYLATYAGTNLNDSGNHLSKMRGSNGRVKEIRQMIIDGDSLESIKRKKIEGAGYVKAAWMECARELKSGIRIPKWLKKKSDYGDTHVSGNGIKTVVEIVNRVKYASNLISKSIMDREIAFAYKNYLKFMKKKMEALAKSV